jgi:hypothetical protein
LVQEAVLQATDELLATLGGAHLHTISADRLPPDTASYLMQRCAADMDMERQLLLGAQLVQKLIGE